ncbi:MAG: hypothetical protein HY811_01080 [Planctomycetes bacterium]|nr:hypothetical protein [Planctomycetota bacterium]
MKDFINSLKLIEILAIWGAALSTILAVFKIFEYRRDKASIKVSVKQVYESSPTNSITRKNMIRILVVNKGRRPVTLKEAGLRQPKNLGGNDLVETQNLSKEVELTEGKSKDFYMDEDQLKEKEKLSSDKYVAFVRDATGKYYWSHNWLSRWRKLGRIK